MKMESSQEEAFARQTAATISDEDLANLTEFFIFEVPYKDDAGLAERTLREVEPERLSQLCESIIKNPANAKRLTAPWANESRLDSGTPIERICGLMGEGICPSSVADFTAHPEKSIRKAAVLAICAAGRPDMVPVFANALEDNAADEEEDEDGDEDEGVRSYALMGLNRALQASRLDATVVQSLYPLVLRMVQKAQNADTAPQTLVLLDPSKAATDLMSGEMLQADYPELFEILECFPVMGTLPSREKLEELFSGLEPRPRKYPNNYSLGEVLRLAGCHRLHQDETKLRFYMDDADGKVAEGAAAGWLAFHGLERVPQAVWARRDSASAPAPLKQYHAIYMFDAEVRNGGFAQYFFNPSGNSWELAMEGLEETGSVERLGLLKEAVSLIAGGKPSPDRDTRGRQLAKALKQDDEAFGFLDKRYYACKEHPVVLLAKLVMKHSEVFRNQIDSLE